MSIRLAWLGTLCTRRRGRRAAGRFVALSLVEKKEQLKVLLRDVGLGNKASSADQSKVESLVQELEKLNPTSKPLSSPLFNGQWELLYTTNRSISGATRPSFLKPSGPIYQTIDTENLKARNIDSAPIYFEVSADLMPKSDSKVAVHFKEFKLLKFLPFPAPESFTGWIDTTYLDETLRVSRGDQGNLFILEMKDPAAKP